jgi:hypothetical protein
MVPRPSRRYDKSHLRQHVSPPDAQPRSHNIYTEREALNCAQFCLLLKPMNALPFRDTKLAFDRDVFTKINQGSNRAESIKIAAGTSSVESKRPMGYDIDSLRKVMGSGPSHHRALPTRDTTKLEKPNAQITEEKAKALGHKSTQITKKTSVQ